MSTFLSLLHALITTVTCIIIAAVVFFSTWYLAIWVNIWCYTLYSYRTPACHTWYLICCTCHVIFDTWYLTPDIWHMTINMLSPGTSTLDIIIVTPDCGLLYLTPVLHGIFMIITVTETWHDYYIVTIHLVLLNPCTPELLYSWTPEKGWLLILLLLIPVIG